MLKFTDGMQFNTSGELRITTRSDGMYVVGNGMLVPVSDREEANRIIAQSKPKPSFCDCCTNRCNHTGDVGEVNGCVLSTHCESCKEWK